MAARPTIGALAPATALAPTAVVPKGTTELAGGAAAAAGDPRARQPDAGQRHERDQRDQAAPNPSPGPAADHPVHSFTASISWRRRAKWKRSKRKAIRGSSG